MASNTVRTSRDGAMQMFRYTSTMGLGFSHPEMENTLAFEQIGVVLSGTTPFAQNAPHRRTGFLIGNDGPHFIAERVSNGQPTPGRLQFR